MWQGWYQYEVTQWGVGHGGFNSQSLLFQELARTPTEPVGDPTSIHIIYDCGSGRFRRPNATIIKAIDEMVSSLVRGSTIDLLAISHFDQDHVNGLNYLALKLASMKIGVTRIWTPLTTNIEALYAITASGLTGIALSRYAALIGNPTGELSSLFPGAEVTPIAPSEAQIPLPRRQADGSGPQPETRPVTLKPDPAGNGLVASAGLAENGEPLWEIRPYVIESSAAGARAVSRDVRSILGKPIDDCSIDDLLKLSSNKLVLAKFHDFVRGHHASSKAIRSSSSARSGPNLSTLCVYSGPVSPYEWCHYRRGWKSVQETPYAVPIAPAWLGTGDAGLQKAENVSALRNALTESRLDRVGVSSAPHHGSRHDSNTELWTALPNVRDVTIEASHLKGGTANRHPHQEVLDGLKAKAIRIKICVRGTKFYWIDRRYR